MIILAAFLAQGKIDEHLKQRATKVGLSRATHETILVYGVVVVITLTLILLAYILYRKRHRRHAHSPHSSSLSQSNAGKIATLFQHGRRRRKGHRRRREHRPRNPTLAETGGLPPIRSEDPPPPPAPPP